jgi:hypothetical protein
MNLIGKKVMEAAAFNNRRNLKPNNCLTNDI